MKKVFPLGKDVRFQPRSVEIQRSHNNNNIVVFSVVSRIGWVLALASFSHQHHCVTDDDFQNVDGYEGL